MPRWLLAQALLVQVRIAPRLPPVVQAPQPTHRLGLTLICWRSFSELMAEVFGEEAGVGARSAVGMGSLPGNIPVEVECIFEV